MQENATKKRKIATLLTFSTKQRKILQRFYPKLNFFTPTLLARWYVFTSLPNYTILTSSVLAILKALTNTFLGPSLGVVKKIYLRVEVFPTGESAMGLTGWTLSYLILFIC